MRNKYLHHLTIFHAAKITFFEIYKIHNTCIAFHVIEDYQILANTSNSYQCGNEFCKQCLHTSNTCKDILT